MILTLIYILIFGLLWDLVVLAFFRQDHTFSHYIHLFLNKWKIFIALYGIALGFGIVLATTIIAKLLLVIYAGLLPHFLNWKP